MIALPHDPFAGEFPVGVRTLELSDPRRGARYPCDVWHPAQAGRYPLVVFSHSSGGRRRQSTFLCAFLASRGYLVAAMDHSEAVLPQLQRKEGESAQDRARRIDGWIDNRVPDVALLLDRMLDGAAWDSPAQPDPSRIGIVGHSFGGWTALAAPETDARIGAVVALAPAGASNPPPGIIPCKLTFEWGRDVPTLFVVAEDDSALPIAGMHELFDRTRASKRMAILRRAGHQHFCDEFAPSPGQCTAQAAHLFVRTLALCHFDAVLRDSAAARRFLESDIRDAFAAHGIDCLWR